MDTAGVYHWNRSLYSAAVTLRHFRERQNFFHNRTHVIFPFFEPCPRPWRRRRTTGQTKSTRVSFAGMRRGNWGWSWRAAQRMDSSRLSASFSRAERSAIAANSSRMNSCWKSMIPLWLDSPPGTSMLWSSTAKTPSDSSVSNKVRFVSFRRNFLACRSFSFGSFLKTVSFFPPWTRFSLLTAPIVSQNWCAYPKDSILTVNHANKSHTCHIYIIIMPLFCCYTY